MIKRNNKKDKMHPSLSERLGDPEYELKKAGLFARLRGYFLAGILVTAPLGITLYIAWKVILFADTKTRPLISKLAAYLPPEYADMYIPGLGIVLAVIVLILIGLLAANFLGRLFMGQFEVLVTKMPVIRTLYGALKQILEAVISDRSAAFSKVVLVEYPRKGMWGIAFKTADTAGEIAEMAETEMINIFVPTTPNPTSGFLLFVPLSDVIELDMSIEEGIKYVISGGIISPDFVSSKDDEVGENSKILEDK